MSQQPWGDVPLFREIQKILSAGGGPINKELAKQVGVAIATQEGDPPTRADSLRRMERAVGDIEPLAAGYTRRSADEPARIRLIRRGEWVKESLEAWSWLFEHLAGRFSPDVHGVDREEEQGALQATLAQITPLLIGIQIGTLLGHLAREAIARYDLPIPRDDDGRLFFVDSNIAGVAADYRFEEEAFAQWLALQSVARHLVVRTTPWASRYFKSLLIEIVDAMEIDIGDLERRMSQLQSGGFEELQEGLQQLGGLPLVETDRHRRAIRRLAAFVAVFEGYAIHVAGAIADTMLPSAPQIQEGMLRRRVAGSTGDEMLSSVLGVGFDRELEAAGRTFCAAVVELRGVAALNRMWDAPDNLPTYDEIADPFAWMERVLDDVRPNS